MSVRLGVELSPLACRIVELDSRAGGDASATHVRSFARLSRAEAETSHRLAAFRQQPAAAVVWGLQADHRQVVVEQRSFRRMRREAVATMQHAGVETRGRVADIFAARRSQGVPTRTVVVALASMPGLAAVLRWLAGEGVHVQSVVTPALALMSLARLRRAFVVPDRIEAYVALGETATAVALVRNGLLLAASELEWGYQDENGFNLPRPDIASRLADEIERFLAGRGARPGALAQVCLCGGLPELRSMALGLMEALDVEVETLDSLFGIDAARLPDPAHEFREHAAELRLAWAAAADWPAPVNLLRERNRRRTKAILSRAAVVAGVVTGVGVAWQVQRSAWWRATPASQEAAQARAVIRPPAVAVAVRRPPVAPVIPPPVPLRPVPPIAVQPPIAPPAVAQSLVPSRSPSPPVVSPRRPAADPPRAVPAPEVPLPFEAALGTILYGPGRQLAIVDGRIVQIGDEVNGARVVDITPTTVLLRDVQGRLRRLALGSPGR